MRHAERVKMKILSKLRCKLRDQRGQKNEEREWVARSYESPSPSWIKREVLLRLGAKNGTWVETATFMGDTTALLAHESSNVYTIEPESKLF